jgi:hypothetical protein
LGRSRQWLLDQHSEVPNLVHPHGPCDVFDLLLAHVFEREMEPIADLITDDPADADPAGLGERLQPRRHVHPVAENVVLLNDHVAEVNPEAERMRFSGGIAA